jgi:hypothetical protein
LCAPAPENSRFVVPVAKIGFYISSITITDVQPVPPEILKQPLSKILYPGRTAQFEVESLGTNLRYQWRKMEAISPTATTSRERSPADW